MESLHAILAPWRQDDAPGLVASVRHRGRTLLRRGCGLAHLDARVPNTPATRLRIGSTSKHFIAVLLLQLRDEGRLRLADPIARWLPELPASQGARTLQQLLTHTGGLRDFLDLSLLSNGMALIPDDAILDLQCRQQDEDNFPAGEGFAYNNGGYRLLSIAIERELGQPLAQGLKERLFEPLAMHDTALWPRDLEPLSGAAQTHLAQPDGSFRKGLFPCSTLGEGGIASTLDDMQRWMAHLPQSPLLDELTAPATLANGFVNAYGLGLIRETLYGVDITHHAGGMVGGNSQMLIAPAHDVQIAVMCNRSDVSAPDLAQQLLLATLGIEAPAPAPVATQGWEGHYFCAASGRHVAIERRGGQLLLRHFGVPLPLVGSTTLRTDHAVLKLSVRQVDGGVELFEQGRRHRCLRFEPGADAATFAAAFAGDWHCEALDARIRIAGQHMHIAGRHGRSRFTLQPLREDLALLGSVDLTVPFGGQLRADGEGLLLDTARTRRLRLRRAV